MPKLKFKKQDDGSGSGSSKKKSSNKKKKRHRSKSPKHSRRHGKHRYYDPPKIYDEEPGWTPQQDDEAEWRERLFSAMMEDEGPGGGDAFYSRYDENPTTSMNDEEYREYIMNGMYRKRHAEEIAQEEARAAEAARREREHEEAQARARKEHARMIEEQQRQEAALRRLRAQDSRAAYEARWGKLEAAETIHSKREIPWPVCPGVALTAQHVREFVLSSSSSKKDEDRKAVRKEQLRYHPDKFSHRVLAKFGGSDKDKARLHEKANEVSGWLNEIWQTLQQ